MKPNFLVWLACLVAYPVLLLAQGGGAADALERKYYEERDQNLNAKLRSLEDTLESFRERANKLEREVATLRGELQKMRDDNVRFLAKYATREDLNTYVSKLQEIENKRQADMELVLKKFNELAKIPIPTRVDRSPPPADSVKSSLETGVYEVKKGEALIPIITAWNDRFAREGRGAIDLEQVKKANPGLNPDHITIGQRIVIPIPPKK